jgi:O-antigen ligase
MSSSAHAVRSSLIQANLRGTPVTLLIVAALAAGFLWSSGHDGQRCVELVLLALLCPFMLAGADMAGQIAWMSRPARCCLAAFFALGAVSALNAFSLRHALYEWSILLLLSMMAALVAAELARSGAAALQTVLRCLVAVGLLHFLRVGLMYSAAIASGVQADMHTLAVGFSNARFFNHAQTVLLPLAVLLFLQAPAGSAWRRASFVLAAWWWAFIFVSEARASVVGLGAGCAIVFVLCRAHAHAFLKTMVLTAIVGAAIYVAAFILLPLLIGLAPIGNPWSVVARTAAEPTSGRTLLWKLALQLAGKHFWLGVGPHHFAHEGATLYYGAHPHDVLLQIAAEWGIPALLCLLGAVSLGARALVRSSRRVAQGDLRNQQILVSLVAACVATCVDGLFSGVLVMPQSQLSIALVVGCTAGWVRSRDTAAPALTPPMPMRFLGAAIAAAALSALAWSVAPDVLRHAKGGEATPAEKLINNKDNWPRLWEAGYF